MQPSHFNHEVSSPYINSAEHHVHDACVYPLEDSTQLYEILVKQGYLEPSQFYSDTYLINSSFAQEEMLPTQVDPSYYEPILTRVPTPLLMPRYRAEISRPILSRDLYYNILLTTPLI